jgi:hypothetical protein
MNGVILLDAKTGRLLSSKQYKPNFGIQGTECGTFFDPLHLSAFLFALHSNASASTPRAGESVGITGMKSVQHRD